MAVDQRQVMRAPAARDAMPAASVEESRPFSTATKAPSTRFTIGALRSDPSLQGKVVLKLTITPSGRSVPAGSWRAICIRELESKLTGRVLLSIRAKDVGRTDDYLSIDFCRLIGCLLRDLPGSCVGPDCLVIKM